ncbi:MAG: peptidoglycan DD-metalloendopeptidase family protein [Erysipelotrichaceae bacterium]|nr:peptidoglycan DD-metalloendopeptidase family protein [Erysipelotrichaceae bacterium]
MRKKLMSFILVILVLLLGLNTSFFNYSVVYADGDETSEPDDDCDKTCRLNRAREKQKELEAEMAKAKENYDEYMSLASKFAKETEALEAEIAELVPQIEDLTTKIDILETSIAEKEKLVEELNERVLNRMADAQGTMHFNPYLDFLLGSKGFADLIRRIYGIEAINAKEENDREELAEIILALQTEKAELDTVREELENKKVDLEIKQAEAEQMRSYYVEAARIADEEIDDYRNQIDEQIAIQTSISFDIEDLLNMDPVYGFTSPVPGSHISAGFPYYPASFGGGVHLGVDYAAKVGTTIYAPADGVIIISDDNCATYGYLGNSCGGAGGGVSYGGNQLYMLCSVNGTIYALTFSHLYSGSVHAVGVVTQGTAIARVGSSGNSTGPHCHIEMYYLGEGENEDIPTYINALNSGRYSLSFNCGWGSAALANICSNKGRAPCRLNGADYLPH